jgi:hypothetical protein
MGRGLSELQKRILKRAFLNRLRAKSKAAEAAEESGFDSIPCLFDVLSCEVAADYFRWPLPRYGSSRHARPMRAVEFYRWDWAEEWRPAGQVRPKILCERRIYYSSPDCPEGTTRYEANRVHSTIGRAFRSLVERGLGTLPEGRSVKDCRATGFILTEKGFEVARSLTINDCEGQQ